MADCLACELTSGERELGAIRSGLLVPENVAYVVDRAVDVATGLLAERDEQGRALRTGTSRAWTRSWGT